MFVQQLVSFGCALFNTPVLLTLMCIIFLASIGKSLGVRRAYTQVLLKIFEVNFIIRAWAFIENKGKRGVCMRDN